MFRFVSDEYRLLKVFKSKSDYSIVFWAIGRRLVLSRGPNESETRCSRGREGVRACATPCVAPQSVWHMHYSLSPVGWIADARTEWGLDATRALPRVWLCSVIGGCGARPFGLVLEIGFWTRPRGQLIDFRSNHALAVSSRRSADVGCEYVCALPCFFHLLVPINLPRDRNRFTSSNQKNNTTKHPLFNAKSSQTL